MLRSEEMQTVITRNLHRCFCRIKIPSFSSSSSSSPSSPPGPLEGRQQNLNSVPSSAYSPHSSVVLFNISLYDEDDATSPQSEISTADSAALSNSAQPLTWTAVPAELADSHGRSSTDAAQPFCPEYCYNTKELSSAMASRRLLPPSSPRRSKAIADPTAIGVSVGFAVPIFSTDPYKDFRTSMEQMAEAIGLLDQCSRRELFPELLLCYLVLNRKNTHKHIIDAFVDLMADAVEPAPPQRRRRTKVKEKRGGQ